MSVLDAPLEQVANSSTLTVDGTPVTVQRLKLRATVKLAHEVFSGMTNVALQNAAISVEVLGVAGIVALLEEDRLARCLALITDQDGDWCLDHFELSDTVSVARAFLEVNDLESLRLVFTEAAAKLSPQISAEPSSDQSTS